MTKELIEALTLAANRLRRLAIESPTGSRDFVERCEWADEARAALAAAQGAQPVGPDDRAPEERLWLDRSFQPWRVWTIEMPGLPEYVPAARADIKIARAEAVSEFVAGLMTDENVGRFMRQRICCDGRDCGCMGADVASYLEWISRPNSALAPPEAQPAPVAWCEARAAKALPVVRAALRAKMGEGE